MKEMIQKNKGRLISSAFVMCMGMILGYTCENSLWVNGTFAVTYVIAIAVTFYDNRNRQQSDKVIRMVTWIVPGMTLLSWQFCMSEWDCYLLLWAIICPR